jgi:CheY-like chemotaxis protein
VCRRLREHGLDKAHIVAITGYGQDEDRRRSRDAGFDEHFVKPVDPDALMRRLEAASALGDRGH